MVKSFVCPAQVYAEGVIVYTRFWGELAAFVSTTPVIGPEPVAVYPVKLEEIGGVVLTTQVYVVFGVMFDVKVGVVKVEPLQIAWATTSDNTGLGFTVSV